MKTLFKLMDLKTLVAGSIPVIFGSVFSLYRFKTFSLIDMLIVLFGIILLQSSTNMINDLFDYKRGSDGEKGEEKALASGEASVSFVKKIIYTFLSMDIIIALYYSVTVHWSIFLIACIASFIIYSYSGGKKPISYTPYGEVVAGSTMGFGIMTTVIFIQSGIVSLETFLVVIPTSIFIGTILLTNNISDWKEDKEAGRKTLPIVIGLKKAEILWIFNCSLLLVLTGIFMIVGYFPMESLLLVTLLLPYKAILGFKHIKKQPDNKPQMMGLIGKVGVRFHIGLIGGILIANFI